MGPLSGKQHREYLKLVEQEKRESAKMEREESRKQELHEIKKMEAASKANQSLGHKEQVHKYKMGELKVPPLGQGNIPTPNPLADTGMFSRGQHLLPFQAEDRAKARKASAKKDTDTVPAMLTPGEAVIPEPAAQNPKNKPLIKKMVQEGRKANNMLKFRFEDGTGNVPPMNQMVMDNTDMRDGTVSIVKSDAIGTHPDVPSSSFSHGTTFSRGSSESYHYDDGVVNVPRLDNELANYQPEPSGSENVPPVVQAPVTAAALPTPLNNPLAPVIPVPVGTVSSVGDEAQNVSNISVPVSVPAPGATVVAPPPGIPAPVNPNETLPVTKADDAVLNRFRDVPPTVVSETRPPIDVAERMKFWTDQLKSSQDDVGKAMLGKSDEDAIKSVKDVFTFKGFKSLLGLNDQELARLALSTVAGQAMGYDLSRSLAYGGRQAFESSLRRQAQESQDNRADKRTKLSEEQGNKRFAIQMTSNDLQAERADKAAKLAQEKVDLANRKLDARETLDRMNQAWRENVENRRYEERLSAEGRAEFRQDNNRFEDALAKDFGPNAKAVRDRAISIVAEAKTPQERSAALQKATIFLNSNVYFHRASSGGGTKERDYKDYVNESGNVISLHTNKDGNLVDENNNRFSRNKVKSLAAARFEEQDVVSKVNALIPANTKDINNQVVNPTYLSSNINRLFSGMPGLSGNQKATILEASMPQILQQKQFDSATLNQVLRANVVKELAPADSKLWEMPDKEVMSAKSAVNFTKAIDNIKARSASDGREPMTDQQAYSALSSMYKDLDKSGVTTAMEKAGVRTPGSSLFMDWAYDYTNNNGNKYKNYMPKPKQ